MDLGVGDLGLDQLVVEPEQLVGGVSGGGQQPQVEVVAEVAVDVVGWCCWLLLFVVVVVVRCCSWLLLGSNRQSYLL